MATKKFDRTVWHGTDCDKVTSLFEYGLLVRYITKEKSWQCIYRNPHESNKFSYSWISEEDMREMFLTGWAKDDLKSFCSYVGDTWNDWLLRPVATRIYDLVSYYGAEEIFGNSYRTYTAKEVCLRLRIKYMEEIDFEKCEGNYLDVYPLIGAVLQKELRSVLGENVNKSISRNMKIKATKYRNDYRVWLDYAGDYRNENIE